MPKDFNRSKFAVISGITALLLSVCSTSAFASSGFITHCSEATEVPAAPELPTISLKLELIDHGLIDAAADMKAPAAEPTDEDLPSPALTEVATTSSTDDVEEEIEVEEQAIQVSDPPGTALRLPGVAEKDQPRFRRQMNRTDI